MRDESVEFQDHGSARGGNVCRDRATDCLHASSDDFRLPRENAAVQNSLHTFSTIGGIVDELSEGV